jgi:flagellar basal-body rod protein FlgB
MDKGSQILEQIIRMTTFRHKVLASNIANVDTPGYKTKDVPFKTLVKNQILGLSKTNPNHLKENNGLRENGEMAAIDRSPWEDGNNVTLDMELANMTENALLYEAGTKLFSKKLQMYRNAIKGR